MQPFWAIHSAPRIQIQREVCFSEQQTDDSHFCLHIGWFFLWGGWEEFIVCVCVQFSSAVKPWYPISLLIKVTWMGGVFWEKWLDCLDKDVRHRWQVWDRCAFCDMTCKHIPLAEPCITHTHAHTRTSIGLVQIALVILFSFVCLCVSLFLSLWWSVSQ